MRRYSGGSLLVVLLAVAAASAAGCGDSNEAASCSGSGCEPHIGSATDGGESSAGVASTATGAGHPGTGGTAPGESWNAGTGGEAGASEPTGSAGAPNEAEPCDDPGALRCAAAAEIGYFECVDGFWQPSECERGELCDNETGECAPVIVDCAPLEPGDTFCDGSTRVLCGPDLVSVEREACDHGCSNGECVSAECGDGKVQSPEQCDDGNDDDADACLSSCLRARCGDGLVRDGEETCDDGNPDDDDACTSSCAVAECGDGLVWEGHEFCDDGNDDDADGCPTNCQEQRCGDGYLVRGVEACDDSNDTSGDGCSSDCHVEVSALSLGDDHSCAVLHDGRLKCWGSNEKGQLGFGQLGDWIGDSASELGAALPAVLPGPVSSVSAGRAFTCAIVDKRLWCWGDNEDGQLGRESDATQIVEPAITDLVGPVIAVSAGALHACAVLESGAVKCWGANERAQLGADLGADIGDDPGEMGGNLAAVELPAKATSVACGLAFSCAILENRRFYCWGNATSGEVGPNPGEVTDGPRWLQFDASFDTPTGLALGAFHACAFVAGDDARCWGDGQYGQRASGDTLSLGEETGDLEILGQAHLGVGTLEAVVAGYTSTCSLLTDGTARCFGENSLGVLAKSGRYSEQSGNPGHLGDDETTVKPLRFGAGDATEPKVRAIDLGAYHGCALLDTGKLACWGDNRKGQLGIGTIAAPNDVISDDIGELPREALVE